MWPATHEAPAVFLYLLGPFEYARSTAEPSKATVMTRAKAYRYKDILEGTEVVELSG